MYLKYWNQVLKNLKLVFKKSCDAFILLEVVIALGIMTVSSVYFVTSILQVKEFYCNKTTRRHMELLIDILGDFVARNGRLPYPSKADGYEFDWPVDEIEWEQDPAKFIRGIVPYRTLGISPEIAKDGYGYFFSYRINPTLGGRQSVISVPPNDIREHLDIVDGSGLYLSESQGGFKGGLRLSTQIGENQVVEFVHNRYSSYSNVRSYARFYHSENEDKKIHTKTWDIAFRIPQAQLKCYIDGRQYCPEQEFYLIEPHNLNLINSTARDAGFLAGLAAHIMFLDGPYSEDIAIKFRSAQKRPRESYKIKDCIALVLISHGKSHGGAILAGDQVVPVAPSASNEKKANSNEAVDSTTIYVNSNGGTGSFDDIVTWVSRFELATRARFPLRPGIITYIDFTDMKSREILKPR